MATEPYGIELPTDLLSSVAQTAFFDDVDRKHDWQAAITNLSTKIAGEISGWETDDPSEVISRLVVLRDDIAMAGIRWPNRIAMACDHLAEQVVDPSAWVRQSLNQRLFPEAANFVSRAIATAQGSEQLVSECIEDPRARLVSLHAVLVRPVDDCLTTLAVQTLRVDDFRLLETLMFKPQVSEDVQARILRDANPGARGAMAVAMLGLKENPAESIPATLRADWLSAALEVDLGTISRFSSYDVVRFIQYLAEEAPSTAEELIRRQLRDRNGRSVLDRLGMDVWACLPALPTENKTKLLRDFQDPVIRWALIENLVGSDVDWLTQRLDDGEISPDEAVSIGNFQHHLPIDKLADALVPRGIGPERIAFIAISGGWVGKESAHWQGQVDQFEGYSKSENPSVAAVGKAGVEMFTRKRDQALDRERRQRVRGEI
jgi:hypothetical protein